MSPSLPPLPYGIADYTTIRAENMAYVDKTRFIAELERTGKFLFYLRPRRFGKSLLINQLWCYYDLAFADRFESLFSGTWIGDHPTAEKNSYLVLHFSFSAVDPDPDRVEISFETYIETMFLNFIERYRSLMDKRIEQRLLEVKNAGARLRALFSYVAQKGLKLLVLIDEYDNFTNTILSLETVGKTAYHQLTHGTGFFRHFFNVLKDGTGSPDSGLARLFVAGVSPVTMDDVTSGYNIGIQASLYPNLAEASGFTREEVRVLVATYRVPDMLGQELEAVLDLMERWYAGYRFANKSSRTLYNPDMVLYFIHTVTQFRELPPDMIDHNVRIDYGKLHHLMIVDRRLNGNFSRLKQVVEDGYLLSDVATGFPLEALTQEQNFISLLYYFGLVTFRDQQEGAARLEIPNQTVARLMYGYLRQALDEAAVFEARLAGMVDLIRAMAYRGDWLSFFRHLADRVQAQSAVRDFLGGEKVIQGFLLAYLSVADHFTIRSEHEMNKGFCDLFLEPFQAKYPDIKFGYLIELKYFKRGEVSEHDREMRVAAAIEEGRRQLAVYRRDERLTKVDVTWICPILVFHGWELIGHGVL